jgi:hypothetical protein
MGLGDAVFDNLYAMLDGLSSYDYYLEQKDVIIELIADSLYAVNRLSCISGESSAKKEDFLIQAKEFLREFIMINSGLNDL